MTSGYCYKKKLICNKPSSPWRWKVLGIKNSEMNEFQNGLSSALSEEENK